MKYAAALTIFFVGIISSMVATTRDRPTTSWSDPGAHWALIDGRRVAQIPGWYDVDVGMRNAYAWRAVGPVIELGEHMQARPRGAGCIVDVDCPDTPLAGTKVDCGEFGLGSTNDLLHHAPGIGAKR